MVDLQLIAFFLLIARIISVIFICLVIRKQAGLFGKTLDIEAVPYLTRLQIRNVYLIRRVLFILSLVILAGNLVPIVIDAITLFNNDLGRPTNLRAISIAYAFSNALTAMVSAIMIWTLYKLAGLGANTEDSK